EARSRAAISASSPRTRGPITTDDQNYARLCSIACSRRMGPRFRGDDAECGAAFTYSIVKQGGADCSIVPAFRFAQCGLRGNAVITLELRLFSFVDALAKFGRRETVVAGIEIHLDRQIPAGVLLPFPIRTDDADVGLDLDEQIQEIFLRLVRNDLLDVFNRLQNYLSLLKRHDRHVLFLAAIFRRCNRWVFMQKDDQIIAHLPRFLQHQDMARVAEIHRTGSKPDANPFLLFRDRFSLYVFLLLFCHARSIACSRHMVPACAGTTRSVVQRCLNLYRSRRASPDSAPGCGCASPRPAPTR